MEYNNIIVSHVSSEENPADPFNKPLSKIKHDGPTRSIGIKFASELVLLLILLFDILELIRFVF